MHKQKNTELDKAKQVEGKHISVATTAERLMNHGGAHPIAGAVQGVKNKPHWVSM